MGPAIAGLVLLPRRRKGSRPLDLSHPRPACVGSSRLRRVIAGALLALVLGATVAPADEVTDGRLTHLSVLRGLATEAVTELLDGVPVERGQSITVIPATTSSGNAVVGDELARALTARGLSVTVLDRPLPGAPAAPATTTGTAVGGAAEAAGTDAADDAEADDDGVDDGEDAAAEGSTSTGSGGSLSDLVAGQAAQDAAATATPAPPAAAPAVSTSPTAPEVEGRRLVYRVDEWRVQYVDESRSFFLGPRRVDRAVAVDVSGRLIAADGETVLGVGRGDAIHLDRLSKGRLSVYESQGVTATELDRPGARRVIEPVVVSGIVASLVYLFYTNQN